MLRIASLLALLPWAGACLAAGLYPAPRGPFHDLIVEGRPVATIVATPPAEGRDPAAELNRVLEKMSGAGLPIAEKPAEGVNVFVGGQAAFRRLGKRPDDLDLGREGFVIATVGDDLVLAGATNIATHYAVTAFLEEHLGCRWPWPDEIGEVIPERKTVRFGRINSLQRPDFRLRWIGRGEWALRNRMNVQTGEPDEFHVKWAVHTYMDLVPPDEYADEHPEFYPMVGGERVDPRKTGNPRVHNLCVSNPLVAEAAARTIDRIVTQNPAIRMISVDPEDTQRFCECDECRALDEPRAPYERKNSKRVFTFTNRVAELVAKKHPDLLIKTIAYHSYVLPPKDPSIIPRDNVVIQLCRFEGHNYPLDDPQCPANAKFYQAYREWLERTHNLALYEYYWKVSWVGLPWPILSSLRADIPMFHRDGLVGVFTQWSTNFATNGLAYYVAAKLLWDSSLDVDAIVEDYHRALFQEAAGPMMKYTAILEEAAHTPGLVLAAQRPYGDILSVFTPQRLRRLDALLSQAEKLAKAEDVRRRLAAMRMAQEYAEMAQRYLATIRDLVEGKPTTWYGDQPDVSKQADEAAGPIAAQIREFLAQPEAAYALDQPNGYIERMLKPRLVADGLRSGFGEDGGVRLTKPQWLRSEEGAKYAAKLADPQPKTFDLWLYGNDLDFVGGQPEHPVEMQRPDGEWQQVGAVGTAEMPGDGRNVCYVIPNISRNDFPGENLRVRISNPVGGPYGSRVFAVWLMPTGMESRAKAATARVQNDLYAVRASSAGFTELGYMGQMLGDGDEYVFEVQWVGFPAP